MKLLSMMLTGLLTLPAFAQANDFPTTGRVEYVLECMKSHEGKFEYLYKCSCVVDKIAEAMPYDDFVEMSTALRYQTLGGERGAAFRDPESVRDMAKKYKKIQQDSNKACYVQ